MNPQQPTQNIEISFFQLMLAVAKRKKFIIKFTLFSMILISVICFIIPLKWESKATISPIADNTTGIQLNANLLSSFGNLPLLASQKMDMALDFLTVMDSRTFREDIVRKFQLIDYFKITNSDSLKSMDIALRKYNDKIFRSSLEQQVNIIRLSAITSDKYLSKDIADYILRSLEKYVKYQRKIKSTLTREFLEQRTNEVKSRIDTLLVIKKDFESTGKAFDINEQTTKTLELYSSIVSKKMLNDIELEIAKQQFLPSNPKVKELEIENSLIKGKIEYFEKENSGLLPKYMLNLDQLPDTRMEYDKIIMELSVMNQVYDYLYPMMEAAKLAELKDMPEIEIIDRPGLAGLHAYPKRLLIIIMLTISALLIACMLAVMDEFISEEQKNYLRQILIEVKIIRKKQMPISSENNTEL